MTNILNIQSKLKRKWFSLQFIFLTINGSDKNSFGNGLVLNWIELNYRLPVAENNKKKTWLE